MHGARPPAIMATHAARHAVDAVYMGVHGAGCSRRRRAHRTPTLGDVMISWLVRWSLRFRLLVAAVAAGVLGFGLVSLPSMAVDNLPEFAPPHVEIQTEALGLSAEEVEQLITSPMEADLLNGVAWLDEIRSVSVPGLSSIELVFEPGTDVLRARQLVAERLTQAFALPNVSTAAGDDAAALVDQPGHDDRAHLGGCVAHRACRCSPGGRSSRVLMGVPGRRQRVDLGPARAAAAGAGRAGAARSRGRDPRRHRHDRRQRALGVAAELPRGVDPGHRRLHRDGRTSASAIQHVLPIQTPEDLGKVVIEGTRAT